MTTRDWAAIGLGWVTEPVSKVFGDNNQSDKRKVADAEIPQVLNIDLLAAAKVDVLGWLNASNSMRVRAQAIARTHKGTAEELREKVFQALLGQRNVTGGRTVTIVKRPLPDGTMYEGTDENEFRQMYAASLVDQGVDATVALSIATTVAF